MTQLVIANLLVLLLSSLAVAQTRRDACHVYVVDVAKARKAAEEFQATGNAQADAKSLSAGQTVFPEFRPAIGEEQLTTKTYRFPGNELIITASVYYTDESMASAEGADSMLVGIVTSLKAQPDAISAEDNAVSEVTYNDNLDTVRAKKSVRVKGRIYLIGIECRCKDRKKADQALQKAEPGNDPLTESQDWIRSNLPQYSGNKLKVESSNPCLLGIVDSSGNAGVSKAVVSLPLNDLDPAKVSVEPQPGSDMWRLWLHTLPGKKTIRFLLYQGSPAESGETDKYSLTFPDREKAEALAEAFRRVINLCAGMKITIQ